MNLHGRAPRAALIRSHGFHEYRRFAFDDVVITRLRYAESRCEKAEIRRAQWRDYNNSVRGAARDRNRNETERRRAYMRARGRARTATIQAARVDGLAYQNHAGRWRV